jgi:predicted DNA-binding transcriptional regulator AlpA
MSDRTVLRLLEARVDELAARVRQLEDRLGDRANHQADPGGADRPRSYLTSPEAAAYLGLSESMLDRWRCDLPGGPPHIKMGRRVLYARADLDAFATSRRRVPLR